MKWIGFFGDFSPFATYYCTASLVQGKKTGPYLFPDLHDNKALSEIDSGAASNDP